MNKQNPFSIYDFLGYLIPGGLLIYSIIVGVHLYQAEQIDTNFLFEKFSEINLGEAFLFIIITYSLGHLLSFISSITVETYANWLYDYPSKYLLGFRKNDNKTTFKSILLITLLFPTALLEWLVGKYLGLREKIQNPLEPFLKDAVISKFKFLLKKLSLLNICDKVNLGAKNFDFDFHRIITHYTYETSKQHQTRMTNYVALYGFLRNLTLLFNLSTWAYVWFLFQNLSLIKKIDPVKIIILIFFMGASYVAFLAFIKFYRRYTLEGFMLIIVDESLKGTTPEEQSLV